MIVKDNKKAVDTAWNRLYSRLEQDGLLNQEQKRANKQPLRIVAWSTGIAAVFVLALFIIRGIIAIPQEDRVIVNTVSDQVRNAFLATLLNDGSVAYVADSTTFSYPAHFDKNKREVTLTGEAFFDVKGNREQPFYVETDYASIEVVGTMFGVQSFKSGSFKVSVSKGEVNVKLKNNKQNVSVKAGECVTLEDGGLRIASDERALQFDPYRKKIYFKDMLLTDIVDVVNKRNKEKLLQVAPELQDYKLTAAFANDDPVSIANVICKTLNLDFSDRENTIVIHEIQSKK